MIIARCFVTLALLVCLVVPAAAQPISDTQQQALSEQVERFGVAIESNDVDGIMGVVPPAVLDRIAAQFGATREQLIEATQQQLDQLMADVKITSFAMDLEGADFVTTDNNFTYALIPTETVIDLGSSGTMRSRTTTLGLLEGDTWYLVRIDDAQQTAIVKELYPFLADVDFPAGTTEAVTP